MATIKVVVEITNANEGTLKAIEMGNLREAIELCFSSGEGYEEVVEIDVIEGVNEAKKQKI